MVIEGVGTLGRVSRIFGATVKLPIIMVTILVCLLLVSGVYAVTYVTPNGDANIVQSAVEAAGFDLTHLVVPQIVPPGQELKLVVQGWACNTPNPWGKGTGGTNDPDGTNVVNLGCEMHASDPKPILGGFIRSFAVLTYNFGWATTSGPLTNPWVELAGPQGTFVQGENIFSISCKTCANYGPITVFAFEMPERGNYTIHFRNLANLLPSKTSNMTVVYTLGLGEVAFQTPYATIGYIFFGMATVSSVLLICGRKRRILLVTPAIEARPIAPIQR